MEPWEACEQGKSGVHVLESLSKNSTPQGWKETNQMMVQGKKVAKSYHENPGDASLQLTVCMASPFISIQGPAG